MDVQTITEYVRELFPGLLGVEFLEAGKERVRARLEVRDRICTTPGVLHGGALMAFADTLGGVAAMLNLAPGDATTTLESKTNFLGAGRGGSAILGECTPLHRGKRTMVWQTRVTSADGKLLAVVTQTQAVLERRKEPAEQMAALFAGKSAEEQKRLLATLERAGAGVYRALAAAEAQSGARQELLQAAEREETNAAALEGLLGP